MLQQTLNGLTLGAVYALFAVGFTMVFGVLNLLNMAHIAIFTLGAYIALATSNAGVSLFVAIPLATIFTGLAGVLTNRIAYTPIRKRGDSQLAGLVASVGILLALEAALLGVFGERAQAFPEASYSRKLYTLFGGLTISATQIVLILCTAVAMAVLSLAIAHTSWGRGLRAVAENEVAAAVTGINIERVYVITFFVSAALGGLAGILFGLQYKTIVFDMGNSVVVQGLAAIVLGGMTSIYGSAIAGIALGLTEVYTVQYVGSQWKNVIPFLLLFALLALRPQGLFGLKQLREA